MDYQCNQFSADPKISHYQAVKRVLKYPKGTPTKGLILKHGPKKGVECYIYAYFSG